MTTTFQRLTFLLLVFFTANTFTLAQPADLPWDPDPHCGGIMTTGIVAVTCGTTEDIPYPDRYTFGLIDINGALPAVGRIDVTSVQDAYHHPAWHIDSIGNVFGITTDDQGNIYVAASSNYTTYYFLYSSVIRYGDIGGGPDDLNAAGTVYKIDGITGQPSVFAVLPQQAYTFTQTTCEGFGEITRTTGPGLGNLVFHPDAQNFYVSNFEDGRIYRLDLEGNILDSYDPWTYDDGQPGPPELEDVAYGLALSNDYSRLFFGNVAHVFAGGGIGGGSADGPSVYSIELNDDGSFSGTIDNTVLPAGANWDNYVGTETFHYQETDGFVLVTNAVRAVSDLAFAPNGELLVGIRVGCDASLHNSYNHGGRAMVLQDNGSGQYSDLLGVVYTSNGFISEENAYGGVAAFENPAGGTEYIFSSADMLSEDGPHGIQTVPQGAFGSPFDPASPAGIIAYIPGTENWDLKGVGGDVELFIPCQSCPTLEDLEPLSVCSGEPFELNYEVIPPTDSLIVTWTDANGNVVNPDSVVIEHTDCAMGLYPYYLHAVCYLDSTVTYDDTLEVSVLPSDLSPFYTVVEEPCYVDVLLDPDCAEYLAVIGELPIIEPGDSGSVTVQIVQLDKMSCATEEITLHYHCSCSISGLSANAGACEDGLFMVELDFTYENTTAQFEVTDQDGTSHGVYSYGELPITIGPFVGDGASVYTFTVSDTQLGDCTASVEVGPIACEIACSIESTSPICEGEILQLYETGGDAVSWLWSSNGNAAISDVTAQNPFAFNVSDGEEFTVAIISATGVTQICSIVVEVYDLPSCTAETAGPICAGEPLLLAESGGDAVSWSWSSDGEAVIDDPTAQNPTATGVSDGEVFTVTVTDANGCVSTCTVTATVHALPSCSAETGGAICEGEVLELFENGGDAVSWSWSSDGAAVIDDPTAQNPTATGVSDGEVFTVTVTDANGCASTCTVTATVHALPSCSAETGGAICEGEVLELFENGGDAVSWNWSSDGAAVIDDPTAQNPTATGVSDGEVFTVTVTGANGCVSSCSVTAEVLMPPAVEASNNSPICVGDMLILSSSVSGGTAPYSYTWLFEGEVISHSHKVYIGGVQMSSAGIYTLEVTDAAGCSSSSETEVVLNENLTDPGEIAGDEYFCGSGYDASPIVEVSAPSGASGPIEYMWLYKEEGGDWQMVPGAFGPEYDPGIIYVTTYFRRCVRIEGCLLVVESNIVVKEVGTEAVADISGPTSSCVGVSTEYSVPEQPGATYSWDFGPGANPQYANTSSVEVSWPSMGVRRIWVTVSTATCTATNYLDVFVSNSPVYCNMGMQQAGEAGSIAVEASKASLQLEVRPNPFSDWLEVDLGMIPENPVQISLWDLSGRLQLEAWANPGTRHLLLETSALPAGVYLLLAQTSKGEVYRKRVVKP